MDTVSVDIASITQIALANYSVISLVSSTLLAVVLDPEVSIITVAFSVFKVCVLTTVDVVVAFSVDDGVSRVAKAAICCLIEG